MSGTVTAVHVAPDSQVKEGDLICTVDASGQG